MAVKKIKKRWVEMLAPKEFNSIELGPSYCMEPEDLIGRKMQVNLMHLTRDIKKQNTRVTFEACAVKDGCVHTNFSGLEIIPSHIKRITKRNKTKIEDSFKCVTKDKINVIIKPVIITKSLVSNKTATDVRRNVKELISKFVLEKSYSGIVKSILNFEIQKMLSFELKKVTPISVSLIKKFCITK